MTQAAVLHGNSVWLLAGCIGEGGAMQRVSVATSPFRVGRAPGLALSLPHPTVSKIHAEIIVDGDDLLLDDLDSTNGTYINGTRVSEPIPLREGDVVQFANVVMRVERERPSTDVQRTIRELPTDWTETLVLFDQLMNQRSVVPAFQPIVSLSDWRTIGYESLARSTLKGLENPQKMFSMAAHANLESELSRILRMEGVRFGKTLPGQPQLFLNTHPNELREPGLVESLEALRREHPGQALVLEIHEAAVTNPAAMKELGQALKSLDIGLAYDDFGAGQARLLELVEVPPDYLKFDMKFIRGIHEAARPRVQMLATLVRMIRDIGVKSLAEGVECAREAEVCRELGFDLAQGYFFGVPQAAENYATPSTLPMTTVDVSRSRSYDTDIVRG